MVEKLLLMKNGMPIILLDINMLVLDPPISSKNSWNGGNGPPPNKLGYWLSLLGWTPFILVRIYPDGREAPLEIRRICSSAGKFKYV